jgi:YD repeat-containing protein
MTTAYSYDNRNRMTKLEHKYGATVLDGYTYALDAAGDITRVTDQNSEYWDYAYDGRDRLTSAVRKNSGATISASYAYTYDGGDNLLTKVEPFKDNFNDGDYTGWTVSSGTWDASNHYLTCTASEGEITKVSSDGSSDLWFSYYDGDTSSAAYYATVYLRYNLLSYVWLKVFRDKMELFEHIAPTCDTEEVNTTLDTNSNATTSQGVWYDVRVRYNGANITVWRAQRGMNVRAVAGASMWSCTPARSPCGVPTPPSYPS